MTWVMKQDLPAMQKMLLMAMANRFNDKDGFCFPSHELLAKESGMNKSSVIRNIEKLEKSNLISVIRSSDDKGNKNVNRYKLNLQVVAQCNEGSSGAQLGVVAQCNEGSGTVQHETVNEPVSINHKDITTTSNEKFFENSADLKLNAVQHEVYVWACSHEYWYKATTSEEDFLRAYCSPKGGMRKQFEERNNVKQPTGGNNGTHRQPPKKLSPAERVRKAAGIGEFAVGAGGSEFDYLENRG